MSTFMQIKRDYFDSLISWEEAKKRLFEYCPDASETVVQSNNKCLAIWKSSKRMKLAHDWFENQLSIFAAVEIRIKHYPNLKVNTMLTHEQILDMWKIEVEQNQSSPYPKQ